MIALIPSTKIVRSLMTATMLLSLGTYSAFGQTAESLIRKLVAKGILTQEEANELRAESKEQAASPSTASASDNDVNLYWNRGLNFNSNDGSSFKGKLGGRILVDAATYSLDDNAETAVGDTPSGVEFRQVRIKTEGVIGAGLPTNYKLQLDFAGGEVVFKDVFIGWKEVPLVGSVQAGHFKENMGLEAMASRRHLVFMERSIANEAFWAERNTGIMLNNTYLDNRITWAAGVYTDAGDSGDNSFDSDSRVTGRLTALPWVDDDNNRLLHIGLSGSMINPKNDSVRFRSRAESHIGPQFVDTGAFAATDAVSAVAEAALVLGPFSLQSEYWLQFVDTPTGANPNFQGYYIQGNYFLTGETRPFKKSAAAFDRIIPNHNFSVTNGGLGAWQIGLRYSSVDLNDGTISGGKLDTTSVGLNWILNPNMKAMLSYIYADAETPAGTDAEAHIIQGRFQIDF